jgi:hypothetical protein
MIIDGKIRTAAVFLMIFFVLASFAVKAQNQEWKCVKNADSILVYSRKSDSANYRVIKAVTEVKSSLSALVSVLTNAPHHKDWVYNNKKAEVLKKDTPFSWIIYSRVHVPWPVTDRDIISKTRMKQDSITKTVTIHAEADPNYLPENPEHVRIPYAVAEWQFIPQKQGLIKIIFSIEVDVGGNVPQWLANLTAAKGPFQTLKNLRKKVKEKKYRTAQLPYIREPHF